MDSLGKAWEGGFGSMGSLYYSLKDTVSENLDNLDLQRRFGRRAHLSISLLLGLRDDLLQDDFLRSLRDG